MSLYNSTATDVCENTLSNILPCEKFGEIGHLLRVTAYVLRLIINNLKVRRHRRYITICGELTTKELANAERLWILEVQATLPRSVSNYENLKRQLDVYDDDDGIIRCRGRFSKSNLPYETKYPILIPRNHHVTRLIVEDCHKRVMHSGVKDTLNELRSRFWIVKGRQYVRLVLFQCNICIKLQGVSYTVPRQADLPQFRVCETQAFLKVGCDLAGPLFIKPKEEDENQSKVYICLFTCTASRAVHLEVVTDLSCQAFIRALDRFTSRRGIPQLIVSDNAKNFKAASKQLNKLFKENNVQKYLTSKKITWHFILQAAPWWGGFYERIIGLVKRSLKKILGQACVSYEELATVTTNIEATLNSRPLTYIHSDEYDEPLCPSHLVTGRRILSLPSLSENVEVEESTLQHAEKCMDYLNTLLQHFWQRWSKEYLLNLREFHKCGEKRSREGHVAVGDVVIVQEQGVPRQSCRMGVVEKLITGADGKSRGATVKTRTKTGKPSKFSRPIQKLFPVQLAKQIENIPPLRRSSRIAARV